MKDRILDYITYSIFLFFAFLAFFLLNLLFDRNIDKFIGLVTVIIWPSVILVGFLFFRKLFAYLFLSIEEFNFFGVQGRLRSVTEVIEEKALELYDQQVREEEMEKKENYFNSEIEKSKQSSKEWETRYTALEETSKEILEAYKLANQEYLSAAKQDEDLKSEITKLQTTIVSLQEKISKSASDQ